LIMPESYTIRRRAGIPAYGNRNPSRLFMTVALGGEAVLFHKALAQPHTVNPRTITVDKNAPIQKPLR
jgi:hypothetical protein